MAAVLNEKGVDPHLGADALQKGIKLYQKICGARVVSKIYDNFPAKPKPKKVTVTKNKIDQTLGVTLPKTKILSYLTSLNFLAHWETDNLIVTPPTWRVKDINIPEDIIEEIARIYGYHNLPSHLMDGPLPQSIYKPGVRFTFIETLKQQLKSLGGTEVLTLSLTGKAQTDKNALKLKNPLGRGTEYLRTSLKPSLMAVTKENLGWQDPYHIFEIANTYHPRKGDLPEERLTLAGLYHGYEFRRAKGAIEHLLSTSLTNYSFIEKDDRTLTITTHKKDLGTIDASDLNNIYYEININTAQLSCSKDNIIKNIPKHPPHIEDITVSLPASKKIGELINLILQSNELIKQVELKDIYKRAHTLRIYYQHPDKTLTGKEVERLRNSVEKAIEKLTHSK
jgi:phenylalanyl-tRNA synthetase beta chain